MPHAPTPSVVDLDRRPGEPRAERAVGVETGRPCRPTAGACGATPHSSLRSTSPSRQTNVRLSLRFLIPLLLALGAFAYVAVPLTDALMQRWFVRDLDMRSSLIADTVQEPLSNLILTGSTPRIVTLFNRLLRDERLYAIGLCMQRHGEPI